ncbi:MAG: DJ-1/PfpI family protein, partial [Saprospiraceae bacterium]
MTQLSVLLFNDFETLDVFGPVEIFGRLRDHYTVSFYSLHGGVITNQHNVSINTVSLSGIAMGTDLFLIPGGPGTRVQVDNIELIDLIKTISQRSTYVLTVCTGTALLAKTRLIDGLQATSNKRALPWVMSQSPRVKWQTKARWVIDGKYYTSSGVSAGMDMSLGYLQDRHGVE